LSERGVDLIQPVAGQLRFDDRPDFGRFHLVPAATGSATRPVSPPSPGGGSAQRRGQHGPGGGTGRPVPARTVAGTAVGRKAHGGSRDRPRRDPPATTGTRPSSRLP
jgi:hypothetical protein